MKTYSTKEAAARAAIHYITLHRWVASGKVGPSQSIRMNGHKIWRWTDSDVEKVRKYKQGHYRKGRGRKAKSRR
jgi:predicted site-specific integrase-resolvase